LSCKEIQILLVVASSYTSADPDAVVVELIDAVIADIAVRCAQRTKDETRLAELQPDNLRCVHLLHGPKEHARLLRGFVVLLGNLGIFEIPNSAWNDAGVRRGGAV